MGSGYTGRAIETRPQMRGAFHVWPVDLVALGIRPRGVRVFLRWAAGGRVHPFDAKRYERAVQVAAVLVVAAALVGAAAGVVL